MQLNRSWEVKARELAGPVVDHGKAEQELAKFCAGMSPKETLATRALVYAEMLDQTGDEERIRDAHAEFYYIPVVLKATATGNLSAGDLIKVLLNRGFSAADKELRQNRGKRHPMHRAIVATLVMYRSSVLMIDPDLSGPLMKNFKPWNAYSKQADEFDRDLLRIECKVARDSALSAIRRIPTHRLSVPEGFRLDPRTKDNIEREWRTVYNSLVRIDELGSELNKQKFQAKTGKQQGRSEFFRHYELFLAHMFGEDLGIPCSRRIISRAKLIFESRKAV